MAVVTGFAKDQDFWDMNPQLLAHPDLKAFHKADKSRGKERSSSIMWWISLCYDMDRSNTWRGIPLPEKQALLGQELLDDAKFYEGNKKVVDPLIAIYVKFADNAPKRQKRMLEQKLEEKTEYMSKHKYDDETYEVLDKMMASDEKHYKMLAMIEKQLSEEDTEGQGKGGSAPSASDEGRI